MTYYKIIGIQERDEDVDYSALGKYINKPFTEVMMKKISLSEYEKLHHLPQFRNSWDKFTQSFLYPFYGTYYSIKECIFPYFILEIVAYVLGLVIVLPITEAILASINYSDDLEAYLSLVSSIPIIGGITVIYLYNELFLLFFNCSYKRMSNITEQRMKGNRSSFGLCYCIDRGVDRNWFKYCCCYLFCEGLELIVRRLLVAISLIVILPIATSIVNVIPVIGQVIYVMVLWFLITFLLAIYSFDLGTMSRKYFTSLETLKYYFTHMIYLSGFGSGSLIIYLIPGINLYYYFYSTVAATRLYCHIDFYESKLKMHEIRWKKKQVKMLLGEIMSDYESLENEEEEQQDTSEELIINKNFGGVEVESIVEEEEEEEEEKEEKKKEKKDNDDFDDLDEVEDEDVSDEEEKRLLQELPPMEDGI